MSSWLDRIFGRLEKKPANIAKNRLKFVLMHDRADIPAPMMEEMRKEIIAVLSKYVTIDVEHLDVGIERSDGNVILSASIPIVRVNAE